MPMNQSKFAIICAAWRYIKTYQHLLFFTLLLAAGTVACTIYVPVLVGQCIDLMIGPSQVAFSSISVLLKKIAIIVGLTALFQWLMDLLNNQMTFLIVRDMRGDVFQKLQNLPLRYIDQHAHGDLLNRAISNVDQFADGLLIGFTQLFTGVLTILGTLGFMFVLSPRMTVIVVVLTPLSLFAANFIAKRTYHMFQLQSTVSGEQTAFLDEMLAGQKVVQAFSKQQETQQRFEAINTRLEKIAVKAVFFSSLTNPGTRFINGLIYAALAFVGATITISGGLTIGGLATFLRYANQYTKPFNEISGVIAELQNALACVSRVLEVLDAPTESPDKADAPVLTDVKGEFSIRNLSFSYTPEQTLIENFHLEVHAGQKIAIVGPTGCGKTTLINLFMRFYDFDSGSIWMDGHSYADIARNDLRKHLGMVLQDTWLREGTVLQNIALGKPDASEEEIIAAAKAAHAHTFIARLPNGYHTQIERDADGFSHGQRQMLCIARVMLCKPPILILDEATSSIDTRTEVLIQQAFAKLMEGRTSLIIAHRLSTIQTADLILVMNNGKIVEQGSHRQLLRQNGFYTKLYQSQF